MLEEYYKYENDRDISDNEWNASLRVFKDQYRMVRKDDGIWTIRCKRGDIQPFSLRKGELLFYGEFGTERKKNFFLKNLPSFARIHQNATSDAVVVFPVNKIKEIEDNFIIRKRFSRPITDEKRKILQERMKNMHEKKKRLKDGVLIDASQ